MQKAWDDLLKLTNDDNSHVMSSAAFTLIKKFPINQEAWNDLNRLLDDTTLPEMRDLKSSFHCVPDKETAWQYYLHLSHDKSSDNRFLAVSNLISAIPYVKNKNEAWKDLFFLIKNNFDINQDEDRYVMWDLDELLKSIFTKIPDKVKAWEDLLFLLKEDFSLPNTGYPLSYALVTIFNELPDKSLAWKKLIEGLLSEDCILKESQLRGIAKEFIKLRNQSGGMFIQISDKSLAWKDILRLIDHKNIRARLLAATIIGSTYKSATDKNKLSDLLLYLAQDTDLSVRNCAANEIIIIFDLIEDKDLLWDKIIKAINQSGQNTQKSLLAICKSIFSKVPNKTKARKDMFRLASLGNNVIRLTAMQIYGSSFDQLHGKVDLDDAIDAINDILIEKQGTINEIARSSLEEIIYLLEKIREVSQENNREIKSISTNIDEVKENTKEIKVKVDKIEQILDNIRFDIFKVKLNSGDVVSKLEILKKELEKINKIENLNTLSIEKLDFVQTEKLNGLNKDTLERMEEIKVLIDRLPKSDDTQEFNVKLNELKQSGSDILLQKSSAIISLFGFAMQILQCRPV